MRTQQHIIDTKAIKKVLNAMPDHWVVRELTERDYGTDLVIEVFTKGKDDKAGNEAYTSTGGVINVQVKGKNSQLKINNDDTVSFQLEKKSLIYMDNFHTPFLLFNVGVSDSDEPFYFVWVQRYIRDVLDIENPFWRENNQASYSIRIPTKNDIEDSFDKIERIALWPRYIQEMVDFNESYTLLRDQLDGMSSGMIITDEDHLNYLKNLSRRILKLNVLFKYSPCGLDHQKANDLLVHVASLAIESARNECLPLPHKYYFESTIDNLNNIGIFEEFVATSTGETVY